MNQKMTITKNDFFTANNFETLQDISKKYPEWKDFCMEIVNQMDDKFGLTMYSETSAEIKQLVFIDYNMAQRILFVGLETSELQEDRLYLYKFHAVLTESGVDIKSKELFDTGVNIAKMLPYIKSGKVLVDGVEYDSITLQTDDDTYNVGDTLISLDTVLANEEGNDVRYDYNGAMYEVAKVEGKVIYLRTKDNVNTPFNDTQTLYLYNREKRKIIGFSGLVQ